MVERSNYPELLKNATMRYAQIRWRTQAFTLVPDFKLIQTYHIKSLWTRYGVDKCSAGDCVKVSPHSSPHRGQIQDLAKSTGYAPKMLQFEKWNLVKTVLLTILAMPQRRTRNLSRKLASFAKTETHNICNLFLLFLSVAYPA